MDKYIRKLDAELSRFEQELQLKDPTVGRPSLSSISDMQQPFNTSMCSHLTVLAHVANLMPFNTSVCNLLTQVCVAI